MAVRFRLHEYKRIILPGWWTQTLSGMARRSADTSWYNAFTNAGALLANDNYVATADWMDAAGAGRAEDVLSLVPLCISIATLATDYSFFRQAGMYCFPAITDHRMTGTP
jgi:hypothetical protein